MVAEKSIGEALQRVLEQIPDPSSGLPDPVFRFALEIVPTVNVDLLVRNERGEHLLSWREDDYGAGWHIPGGIVRYNEPFEARIAAVAQSELGAVVTWQPDPVDIKQLFKSFGRRGHFIALLFLCRLATPVRDDALWRGIGLPRCGQLAWIKDMPKDIYYVHGVYADWLSGRAA